jgi:hypothetical protein
LQAVLFERGLFFLGYIDDLRRRIWLFRSDGFQPLIGGARLKAIARAGASPLHLSRNPLSLHAARGFGSPRGPGYRIDRLAVICDSGVETLFLYGSGSLDEPEKAYHARANPFQHRPGRSRDDEFARRESGKYLEKVQASHPQSKPQAGSTVLMIGDLAPPVNVPMPFRRSLQAKKQKKPLETRPSHGRIVVNSSVRARTQPTNPTIKSFRASPGEARMLIL